MKFIKNNKIWILLVGILILASVLRLWQLGNIPPSPDWDEAALGYNAYSILTTGKDEYGKVLPVVLRSFDDYKPALYMYLIVPLIPLFDLSTFTVRLPAAIFGVIGVLTTFFLVKELFKSNKYVNYLALLCALLLAISPWDIQFSRVGFESHIGAVLNLLAALFLIKSIKKPWLMTLSAIFAGLNIYMYQSEKVFTPLFLLVILLIYFKDIIKIPKKYIVSAVVVGVIVVLPMVLYIVNNKESLIRVKGTSVFSDQTQVLETSIPRLERDRQSGDKIGLLFDNRRVIYFRTIVSGYLSHFDLNWLFIRGDLARHHAPNMGLLYLWEFPFLFLGIYFLIFGDFDKRTKLFIFAWFLITPIPASITSGVPHAVRTMNFLPTWQIFISIGLFSSFVYLKKYKSLTKLFIISVLLFASFNFTYYLNQYFSQQNYYTAEDWQYGWKQAVSYVKSIEGKYDKIIVTDSQPLDRSYMFFAFYLKYPPAEYQKYGVNESGGFAEEHAFGKYEFRPLNWDKDSQNKNVLLVGNLNEFPKIDKKFIPLKIINYPNGKPAIEIVGK